MQEFQDNRGKTWKLKVRMGTLRTIKARAGINLAELGQHVDPVTVLDILYSICVDDPDECSPEEFDDRLDGVWEAASSALEAELTDFFHRNFQARAKAKPGKKRTSLK